MQCVKTLRVRVSGCASVCVGVCVCVCVCVCVDVEQKSVGL